MGACASIPRLSPENNVPIRHKVEAPYLQQLKEGQPSTPLGDKIRAQGSPGVFLNRHLADVLPTPSPLSKAPPDVPLPGIPECAYAAPYIPLPGTPPPESIQVSQNGAQGIWQPTRRRALVVGCNYAVGESKARLKGPVNDANCLKHLLTEHYGFQTQDIVLLHDEQRHDEFLPTKENILGGIRWLVQGSQPLDSLFFAFCGRSAQAGQDEELQTGSLEGLLPSDYAKAGVISDIEISGTLLAPLSEGARLLCAIDATPHGLSIGLPHTAIIQQNGWADWDDEASEALSQRKALKGQQRGHSRAAKAFDGTQGGEAVILSNWTDDNNEGDALPLASHTSTGGITFGLIQAIKQGQGSTYNQALRAMRYALKNGPQHLAKLPELSASHRFDLNRPFVL